MDITVFDKTEEYEAEVKEKATDLLKSCNKNGMPVFIAVCTKNDNEGTVYEREMFSAIANDIHLKNDYFPLFVNVTNGFETIPPKEMFEFEMD